MKKSFISIILFLVFCLSGLAVDWLPTDIYVIREVENGFYHVKDMSEVAVDRYALKKPVYLNGKLVDVVSVAWGPEYIDAPGEIPFYENVPHGYVSSGGTDSNGFTHYYYYACANVPAIWHKNITVTVNDVPKIIGVVLTELKYH